LSANIYVSGPDSDPTVRNVALWFNISERDVTLCTPQQAKRYRWKRGSLNKTNTADHDRSNSVFDHQECFFMIRPHDRAAFELTTRILQHRLGVLKAEQLSGSLRERHESLQILDREKLNLKHDIECQIMSWKKWAWPINEGRDNVDDETPVPPVDGHYVFDATNVSSFTAETDPSTATKEVWESFLINIGSEHQVSLYRV
jgi:hypothetical protein